MLLPANRQTYMRKSSSHYFNYKRGPTNLVGEFVIIYSSILNYDNTTLQISPTDHDLVVSLSGLKIVTSYSQKKNRKAICDIPASFPVSISRSSVRDELGQAVNTVISGCGA